MIMITNQTGPHKYYSFLVHSSFSSVKILRTNCFLWIFVGTFTLKDPLCVAPNFVGISLATVQLLLKAKYGNGLAAMESGSKRKLPTP